MLPIVEILEEVSPYQRPTFPLALQDYARARGFQAQRLGGVAPLPRLDVRDAEG